MSPEARRKSSRLDAPRGIDGSTVVRRGSADLIADVRAMEKVR